MQLLNSAHVYKRHSFISKDESVRIPEGSIKHEAINRTVTPIDEEAFKDTYSAESDDTGINLESAGVTIGASIDFREGFKGAVYEDGERDTEPNDLINKESHKSSGKNAFGAVSVLNKEALAVIYKKELEEITQAAVESAYFDALNKKKCELKESVSSVQKMLDELARRHEEFIEQYANELKYMSIDIAEKMLLEKIGVDDTVLKKLVLQNVKNVKNAAWINVELSERLVGLVDSVKKELESSDYKGRISVFAVAEKEDICRVTTDEGTIVSTIGVQADNLRKAFREADRE